MPRSFVPGAYLCISVHNVGQLPAYVDRSFFAGQTRHCKIRASASYLKKKKKKAISPSNSYLTNVPVCVCECVCYPLRVLCLCILYSKGAAAPLVTPMCARKVVPRGRPIPRMPWNLEFGGLWNPITKIYGSIFWSLFGIRWHNIQLSTVPIMTNESGC